LSRILADERSLQRDLGVVARIEAVPSILEVCCRATGMGFAAVARVTEGRWIACAVRDEIAFGLQPGGELKVETTICDQIRASGTGVVIDHVALDQDFCGHPTPALYGFQSYISMPIVRRDGSFFGTLCAIDPKPAKLNNPQIVGMFKQFADLISFHIEAQERLATSEAALLGERETSELREQFIAVLGHDLRNPLASINGGLRLLRRDGLNDRASEIVALIENSVRRMAGLIDNVLDLARGRLGGGLSVERNADAPLAPVVAQVVDELRTAWPDRQIEVAIDLPAPVDCDRARIGQVLSNLLANALVHGHGPVRVRAEGDEDGGLALSVANAGEPIPADAIDRIFEPFYRRTADGRQQGLGLGLYIATEIARAHGGALDVASDAAETRFTLKIPAQGNRLGA
jgi:hypothetical protein